VPVLATIPLFAERSESATDTAAALDSKSSAGEAYRSLRTSLQYVASQEGIRSVVVTSARAGEGKTSTAANLGIVLAQAGQRVVMLDADLRKPRLAANFGLDRREGLSELLSESGDWNRFIKNPSIPNLRVIPSGPIPGNPAEVLTSPRLDELLALLEEHSDLVIIDSPPVLAVADAAILSRLVGGTLLVVDSANTGRSAVLHAQQEIIRAGGNVIGSVLNSFDPSTSPYSYAYSSNYQYTEKSSNGSGSGKKSSLVDKGRALLGSRR
jgi:capsular exopolysaccharide synthesis family protein